MSSRELRPIEEKISDGIKTPKTGSLTKEIERGEKQGVPYTYLVSVFKTEREGKMES